MFRSIPICWSLLILLLVLLVLQGTTSEQEQQDNEALSEQQLYDSDEFYNDDDAEKVVALGSNVEDNENDENDDEWWRPRRCPRVYRPRRCRWGQRLLRIRYRWRNRWCYYYRCVVIRPRCPRVIIPRCPRGTIRRRYRFKFRGRWCYRWRCVARWVPLYRYFKLHGLDHFYTRNAREIGTTRPGQVGRHGYRSEGVACYVFATRRPGTVPLYRYWKASVTDHFYTTNAGEIGTTVPGRVGRHGYKSEGIAGYCYPRRRRGLRPLYRYWKSHGSDHFYTTNRHEIGTIQRGKVGKHGYRFEGIQCYCK